MNRIVKAFFAVIFLLLLSVVAVIAGIAIDHHYYLGLVDEAKSPGGQFVAYLRLNTMTSGPDEYTVALRRWFEPAPIRHNVFGADANGASLHMQWVGPSRLVLTCTKCERLDIYQDRVSWHGVSVIFQPSPGETRR